MKPILYGIYRLSNDNICVILSNKNIPWKIIILPSFLKTNRSVNEYIQDYLNYSTTNIMYFKKMENCSYLGKVEEKFHEKLFDIAHEMS